MDRTAWAKALEHLRLADPELAVLFDRCPDESIQTSGNPFQVLANSIVGQQISVKAATAIFGRLSALLGSWDPEAVGGVSDEQLRAAEIFLIFHLKRPDVLPLDDLGLLRSAATRFGWDYPFDPRRLTVRAEAWRPWRTVGVWYLWRDFDPEPVIY